MLSELHDLNVVAEKYSTEAESLRRLRPEVVEQILDAGFARHFVPGQYGGHQGSYTELVQALRSAAAGCAATAWCCLIYATSGRMAAFLPQAGQSEVWRTGADQPIAAALMPSGTAEPVPGGWLLTGEWQFLSGVDYATWALLCVPGPAAGGKPRFMAVPRSELSVRDTWFSIGMRGTGSNSVVLETVFVPEHRSFSREALATGTPGEAAATCYRVPLLAVAGLPFAALSAGLAQSTLSRWSEWTGTRTAGPRPMRESESVRLEFARSAVENDAAQLLVERAAAVADDLGLARRHAARSARDAAHAASMSRQTVERLFVSTGTRTQRDGDVIQRAWRDVHAAASHAALRFDIHGSAYAQQEWSTKGDSDEQAG